MPRSTKSLGKAVEGKILRWGNSYGIRITKRELQDAGLKPGERVRLWVEYDARQAPMPPLPTFKDPDFDATTEHDAYLARRRSEDLRRRRE